MTTTTNPVLTITYLATLVAGLRPLAILAVIDGLVGTDVEWAGGAVTVTAAVIDSATGPMVRTVDAVGDERWLSVDACYIVQGRA